MNILNKKTIFVVIDACRWDYINKKDCPFIYNLANKNAYIKKLSPSLGYCEISEFFTGATPLTNGNFCQINFSKNSIFERYGLIFKIASLFENLNKKIVHKITEKFLRIIGLKQPIYFIPFNLLSKINPTESTNYFMKNAFNVESIFDIYGSEKAYTDTFVSYNQIEGSDEERTEKLIKNLNFKNQEKNLFLLYIGKLDGIGHKYGPDSIERREAMREVDKIIKEIFEKCNANFIIFGDHGMVKVKNYVNIKDKIFEFCYKNDINTKDFYIFLDSSMVRLKFKNRKDLDKMKKFLKSLDFGKIIDYKDKSYGDIIWLANPGAMIYPDYFNFYKPRGMHGYDIIEEQKGFCIVSNEKSKKIAEGRLVDICPTLCKLLNIRNTKQNEGKSFI